MSQLEQFSNSNAIDSRNAESGLANEYNSISKSDLLSYRSNRSQEKTDTMGGILENLQSTTDCSPNQVKEIPVPTPLADDRSSKVPGSLGRHGTPEQLSKPAKLDPTPRPEDPSNSIRNDRIPGSRSGSGQLVIPTPGPVY